MTRRPGNPGVSRVLKLTAGALALVVGAAVLGYVVHEYQFGQTRPQPQPPPPSEKVVNAPGPDNTITTLERPIQPPQPATDKPGETK